MNTHSRTLTLAACIALTLGGFTSLHAQDATPHQRGGGAGNFTRGPGFDALSQEEKDKFKAAMEKAMQDQKVKDAREKMESASKDFRDAINTAAIAADPSVEPILKKIQEARDKARAAHTPADQPKQ